jgi:Zn-dependent protease
MNQPSNHWSLCIGRWRGVELRLHVFMPLLALGLLVFVQRQMLETDVAILGFFALLVSVLIQELARVIAAKRVGAQVPSIVLAPFGGCSRVYLPADPPAHLVAALAGPIMLLVLLTVSACILALGGDREVHRLLYVTSPQILDQVQSGSLDGGPQLGMSIPATVLFCRFMVWINWCLLLVSLLPIDPCAGAELLRGILWPIVGRNSANSATSHIALGGALLTALLAILVINIEKESMLVPAWFPLAVVSCLLLYGSFRNSTARRYDVGLAIDAFDSDDEEWLTSDWLEEDREAVLVEHLQDKQQEALDRKRREQEASEDARVDAILQRLHNTSFEQLSEEERAILKRASRRYRKRRSSLDDV